MKTDGIARLRAAFEAADAAGRTALVIYLCAGDPSLGSFLAIFEDRLVRLFLQAHLRHRPWLRFAWTHGDQERQRGSIETWALALPTRARRRWARRCSACRSSSVQRDNRASRSVNIPTLPRVR